MMPIMTVFIGANLPGGLTLYWFVTTLLTALMQLIAFRHKKEPLVEVIDKNTSSSSVSGNKVVNAEVVGEIKEIENK